MDLLILLGTFAVGLIIGIPVAVTLGLASAAYMLYAGIPLVTLPQKMYAGMDVFVLLCIPGFILAGNLMNSAALPNVSCGWPMRWSAGSAGGLRRPMSPRRCCLAAFPAQPLPMRPRLAA